MRHDVYTMHHDDGQGCEYASFLYSQLMADNVVGVVAVAAVTAAAHEAQRERRHATACHADDDARDGHRTCMCAERITQPHAQPNKALGINGRAIKKKRGRD